MLLRLLLLRWMAIMCNHHCQHIIPLFGILLGWSMLWSCKITANEAVGRTQAIIDYFVHTQYRRLIRLGNSCEGVVIVFGKGGRCSLDFTIWMHKVFGYWESFCERITSRLPNLHVAVWLPVADSTIFVGANHCIHINQHGRVNWVVHTSRNIRLSFLYLLCVSSFLRD